MTMRKLFGIVFLIAPLMAFAMPPVKGPHANRISKADMEQIMAAISKEPDIPHNVRTVEAVSPDKVAVQTGGRSGMESTTYYDFNVSKRSGKWTVDSSSIVMTSDPANNHRMDSDAVAR
ncbi:MAG TPA: hypothetical protein VLK27_09555 [Chthoniobacterales bacterium]|nr:hypothetical protein [Chthoniobacterales bacterium]